MTKIMSILLLVTIISCGAIKNKHPFKVINAVCENSNNTGYDISFQTSKNVELDSIYFRGEKAKLKFKDGYFKAFVPKSSLLKKDMILHSDSKKEFGNTVSVKEETSMKLNYNEALISYTLNGKKYYYKIKKMLGYQKSDE